MKAQQPAMMRVATTRRSQCPFGAVALIHGSPDIALIVGLGNPGEKYDRTRHNVGFWFLDALAEKYQAAFRHQGKLNGELSRRRARQAANSIWPNQATFMNLSGNCVVRGCELLSDRSAAQVLIVHDELRPAGRRHCV